MEKIKWLNVLRDLACMAVGTFGLVDSQLTGRISPELIAAYVTLLAVPGAVNLFELRRRGTQDTESSSSSRPSEGSRGGRRGQYSKGRPDNDESEG